MALAFQQTLNYFTAFRYCGHYSVYKFSQPAMHIWLQHLNREHSQLHVLQNLPSLVASCNNVYHLFNKLFFCCILMCFKILPMLLREQGTAHRQGTPTPFSYILWTAPIRKTALESKRPSTSCSTAELLIWSMHTTALHEPLSKFSSWLYLHIVCIYCFCVVKSQRNIIKFLLRYLYW